MSDHRETQNRNYLECPYCGAIKEDAYELGDGGEGCGETDCGECERVFYWSRSFTVTYKGKTKS